MSFAPSEAQLEFVSSVRGFLERSAPLHSVRELMDTVDGFDARLWRGLSTELGLAGLAVPAQHGGSAAGFTTQALCFEVLGGALTCAPLLSSAGLAIPLLLAAGCEVATTLLPTLADGSVRATIAFVEDDADWQLDRTLTTASSLGSSVVIDGSKIFVVDGHTADQLLVSAVLDGRPTMFVVDSTAPGVTRTPLETLDLTRKQARIEFDHAPAVQLGRAGEGIELLQAAIDAGLVALAMEQVGGAQRCLDMSVAYAKQRRQFGRPIGSFQAIKHRCADMLVAVEAARSLAYHAAWVAENSPSDLPLAAAAAKAAASEAFTFCADETIQVHGGIGFTWEHDAHLFYRRAHSSAVMLGDATFHRERTAALLQL